MKPRRKQREKRAHAGLWTALVAVASVVVIGFGFYKGVMSLIDSWNEDLPSLDNIESYSEARTTTIYANNAFVGSEYALISSGAVTVKRRLPALSAWQCMAKTERLSP